MPALKPVAFPWETRTPTKSPKANTANIIFLFSLIQVRLYILGFSTSEQFLKESFWYFKNSPKMLETHSENALETILSSAER